jgi:hypothetical protein
MQLSDLTAEAQRTLELILQHDVTDGSSLMSHVGVGKSQREDIAKSLRELERLDLIEVGGAVSAEDLPFTRFAVRPSAKMYLERMLKQKK